MGKSTLMNHILGQKLSITSRKPQTTRHKIVGIDSREKSQAVFVDTPGMHKKEVRAINKMMNRAASSALRDVNLVLFVIDADKVDSKRRTRFRKTEKCRNASDSHH